MAQIKTRRFGLSSAALRWMALVFMLFDHSWIAIFSPHCFWMTCLGRLAFPIYAFLIAEGCIHTRKFWKYALRLLVFAVVSEVPYDFFRSGALISLQYQNVMVTLLLGLLSLKAFLWAKEKRTWWAVIVAVFAFAAACAAAQFGKTDYKALGVATVVMFGMTRDLRLKSVIQILALCLINLCIPGRKLTIPYTEVSISIQNFAVFAMVPILLYNGKKGKTNKVLQLGAYAFYPAHLMILTLLRHFL